MINWPWQLVLFGKGRYFWHFEKLTCPHFYLSELSLKFWCLEGCGRLKVFLKANLQNPLENLKIPGFYLSSTDWDVRRRAGISMFNEVSFVILVYKLHQTLKAQGDHRRSCWQIDSYGRLSGPWESTSFIACVSQILVCGGSSEIISIKINWQVCQKQRVSQWELDYIEKFQDFPGPWGREGEHQRTASYEILTGVILWWLVPHRANRMIQKTLTKCSEYS